MSFASAAPLCRLSAFVAFVLTCLAPIHSFAANVSDAEFAYLRKSATAAVAGGVHVSVKLAHVTLGDADGGDPAKMAAVRRIEQALMQELGQSAWAQGRWDGGLGVVGFYVDEAGLHILRNSRNALSFAYAVHPDIKNHRLDTRFVAVEKEIEARGYAELEVQVRSDTAVMDISSSGDLRVSGGMVARSEHSTRSERILNALHPEDVLNLAAARSLALAASRKIGLESTILTLQANQKALITLAGHADVGAIRLRSAEIRLPAEPIIAKSALEAARKTGWADVILQIRNPLQQVVENDIEIQRRANAQVRAFGDVMRAHLVRSKLKHLPHLGVFIGHLSLDELERLSAGKDPRIVGIGHNLPVAHPMLLQATARMKMGIPWDRDKVLYPDPPFLDAGFRGAYPSIQGNPASPANSVHVIVMDSGIYSQNPMLQGKVATQWESCFGSFNATHESACPGAIESDLNTWDKPFTNAAGSTPGSGEPPMTHWWCVAQGSNPQFPSLCEHGTLVAGAAAGRQPNANPVNRLQGTAPSSKLVSMRVWSMPKAGNSASSVSPVTFSGDLLAGFQSILDATAPSSISNNQDYVVNISSSSTELFSSPCYSSTPVVGSSMPSQVVTYDIVRYAVQQLSARGIPVIASAGNAQSRTSTGFPACIPGVVKVGAVRNSASTPLNCLLSFGCPPAPPPPCVPSEFCIPSSGTNLVPVSINAEGEDPPPYIGERFFLGSGAAGSLGVLSSRASLVYPYGYDTGTSFSAPQIAGVYSVVKAAYKRMGFNFQLDWASLWLEGSASVQVKDQFSTENPKRYHKAIRFSEVP